MFITCLPHFNLGSLKAGTMGGILSPWHRAGPQQYIGWRTECRREYYGPSVSLEEEGTVYRGENSVQTAND